jgi:[protein-PII] uridylyltransferase
VGPPDLRRDPSGEGRTIVLALGGYGREELFPFSDIDLLVCLPESDPPDSQLVAETLFVPLWDSGFDVGHGIRTLPETLALAAEDFEVLISLLDARLLFGPPDVFDAFRHLVFERLVIPLRGDILLWLARRHEERHRRFGDASHLLSPNSQRRQGRAARSADHAVA